MEKKLNGRKALVTGGASGIGAASVRALAARGAKVVIADVDEAARRSPRRRSRRHRLGGQPPGRRCPPGLSLDCDILVNNAGIQRISPIEDFEPEDFRRIHHAHARGAVPADPGGTAAHVRQQFGRIINLSSVHGLRASPFKSAYVSAKHGLEGLSKVTALEGGEHGVTSTASTPDTCGRRWWSRRSPTRPRCTGFRKPRCSAKIMLTEAAVKRLVEPEEVASLVAWLASDDAGMVTGAATRWTAAGPRASGPSHPCTRQRGVTSRPSRLWHGRDVTPRCSSRLVRSGRPGRR